MKVSIEFVKYCMVGIINTFVGLSTAYACLNIFGYNYLTSTACAYVTGILVSFSLNKIFTFKNKDKNNIKLFIKFVLTMLPSYIIAYYVGWLTSTLIFKINAISLFLNRLSSLIYISNDKVVDNVAVIISMIIYVLLGFGANKYFVFTKKNEP